MAATKKIARRKKKGRRVQKTSQKTTINGPARNNGRLKHGNMNITFELSEAGSKI